MVTPLRVVDLPRDLDNTALVAALDRLPADCHVRLYHGTIRAAAASIIAQLRLAPDDLHSVGLTSDPAVARRYGGYKDRASAVVLEVIVARSELGSADLGNLAARRFMSEENGGTGYASVLIYELPERGRPLWPGVRLLSARVLPQD